MQSANSNTGRLLPFLSVFLAVCFVIYEYMLRVMPSTIAPQLMEAYQLSISELGSMMLLYYVIAAPLQIPIGIFLDRYGVGRCLTLSGLVMALGVWLFMSSNWLGGAVIGRILVGLGGAFAYLTLLSMLAAFVKAEHFSFVYGCISALAVVGGVLSDLVFMSLVQAQGWHVALKVISTVGIGLAVCIALVMGCSQRRLKALCIDGVNWPVYWSGFKLLLQNKQLWINAVVGLCLYCILSIWGDLWSMLWLETLYHIPSVEAGYMTTYLFLGWVCGAPLMGWLSTYSCARGILSMSVGATLLLLSMILYIPHFPMHSAIVCEFLLGFFASSQVMTMGNIVRLSPGTHRAVGLAIGYTLLLLGSLLVEPIIHYFFVWQLGPHLSTAIMDYHHEAYQLSLLVCPVLLFVAFMLTFFLHESEQAIT